MMKIQKMSEYRSYAQVEQALNEHGQGHLIAFWRELNDTQRAGLLQQVQGLDLDQVDQWIKTYVKDTEHTPLPCEFEPAKAYPADPSNPALERKYNKALELGKKLLASGKVGAFVVAGGQGTRMGFDGPKGAYPASPVKKKTLFGIFGETIAEISRRFGKPCPWYVMTSPINHGQTKEAFETNQYFGLSRDDVFMFQQGTLPNFSFDGKILLSEKSSLSCSPDGHGGSLKALYQSGAVEDMKRRGVEYISYWQVDNPLINIFDPLFIGLHALDEAQMSSKALKKAAPTEKIGNFCLVDGKVTVIEYSDLPDDLANRRNPDGSLAFEMGSIGVHVISRSFVEKLNANGFTLPLHKAIKKIPFIDALGKRVEPDKPNGIKLEAFVFDALPLAGRSVILETIRAEEFAPVKNATGVDSAESSHEMMIARASSWLESAGVHVPRRPDGSPDCLIEISPSFAAYKDDVKAKTANIPAIRRGDRVYLE